jgi:hypothetical protein
LRHSCSGLNCEYGNVHDFYAALHIRAGLYFTPDAKNLSIRGFYGGVLGRKIFNNVQIIKESGMRVVHTVRALGRRYGVKVRGGIGSDVEYGVLGQEHCLAYLENLVGGAMFVLKLPRIIYKSHLQHISSGAQLWPSQALNFRCSLLTYHQFLKIKK